MRKKTVIYGVAAAALTLAVTAVVIPADAATTPGASRFHHRKGHQNTPSPTASASPTASVAPASPASPSGAASPSPTESATHSASASPSVSAPGGQKAAPLSNVLFDDFSYTGVSDANFKKEWTVRTEKGAPGQSGATWSANTVSFTSDGMKQQISTDGTAAGTVQSEVDSKSSKYFLGTYATRFRFTDTPVSGPTGAHPYETFFTISPNGDDGKYSELDFEYLPAGGWGDNRKQLDFTTWKTTTDSKSSISAQSYAGWHTLVVQATSTAATYFVDGVQVFTTSSPYTVRESMNIAFNAWFIDGELGGSGATRTYEQEADWVYFASGRTLTPDEVQAQVDAQRAAGVTVTDTVS